jgi:hypothetical protein
VETSGGTDRRGVVEDRWRRAVGWTSELLSRRAAARDSIQLREMVGGWQQLGETGSRRARDGRALGEGRHRTGRDGGSMAEDRARGGAGPNLSGVKYGGRSICPVHREGEVSGGGSYKVFTNGWIPILCPIRVACTQAASA